MAPDSIHGATIIMQDTIARIVTVKFTYALKRFFPGLATLQVQAATLREVLSAVEMQFSGISRYLLDDQGRLRQHVNIFVDGILVADRITFSDPLQDNSEVYIMQALSGG